MIAGRKCAGCHPALLYSVEGKHLYGWNLQKFATHTKTTLMDNSASWKRKDMYFEFWGWTVPLMNELWRKQTKRVILYFCRMRTDKAWQTRRYRLRPTPSCSQVRLFKAPLVCPPFKMRFNPSTVSSTGHDTTASAICWTLYNLARHDHYQEKCRQEVMELMQGRDEHKVEWSEKQHTTQPAVLSVVKVLVLMINACVFTSREDLSSLPFTTMCIRESLRLHAPVQAVTRRYTQDMALPGGCTVPTGESDRLRPHTELHL